MGHSLGGATTWAVSFNTATRDERIDSTVIFAGLTMPMPEGDFDFDSGLPLLVLHGDADDVPLDMDLAAYKQASSPKWFVTLLGAEHRLAFTDEASPYDELVTTRSSTSGTARSTATTRRSNASPRTPPTPSLRRVWHE